MAVGLGEKIERRLTHEIVTDFGRAPWKQVRWSNRWEKTRKRRRERHRASVNPECEVEYRRYDGYEW